MFVERKNLCICTSTVISSDRWGLPHLQVVTDIPDQLIEILRFKKDQASLVTTIAHIHYYFSTFVLG